MIWKEKKRSKIRAIVMDKLRGLLGNRKMYKFQDARIMELCGLMKGIGERIDEGVLRCLTQVERMENDRISKRVYAGEYEGRRSVGRTRRRVGLIP